MKRKQDMNEYFKKQIEALRQRQEALLQRPNEMQEEANGVIRRYVHHFLHNNGIIPSTEQTGNQHIYRIPVNIPVRSLIDDSFIHQRYSCHAALLSIFPNDSADIAF